MHFESRTFQTLQNSSPLFLFCAFALAVIHAVPCKLVAPGIALLAMSWLPLWWMLYAVCSVYDKLSTASS